MIFIRINSYLFIYSVFIVNVHEHNAILKLQIHEKDKTYYKGHFPILISDNILIECACSESNTFVSKRVF